MIGILQPLKWLIIKEDCELPASIGLYSLRYPVHKSSNPAKKENCIVLQTLHFANSVSAEHCPKENCFS